ncbi:MAG: AAA family ATPase, partial [Elusimicrobia bacterium]|nr:AAA family ATPase [Elusimicrobiota bacterium]
GFDHALSAMVRDLPGGLKQGLALAAATLHDPEIIFLDEPTAGVAPAARERFWGLIRRLTGSGKTVLVTTHYMDEAEQCGRIALMRSGKLIALDEPEALKSHAFPEPLVEIEPGPGAPEGWLEGLRRDPAVLALKPHGLRWHASVADAAAVSQLTRALAPGVLVRAIRPSLEDVFIRLVEGAER